MAFGGANTADVVGFASKVIEENTSEGALALFLQGCGGDINPVFYKDVDHPRSAEPLGNMLGLSTMRAVRKINCSQDYQKHPWAQELLWIRSKSELASFWLLLAPFGGVGGVGGGLEMKEPPSLF